MPNPIPSQIALSTIQNGTLADGSVVQSNDAAIQVAVNALIVALSNGTNGQFLQATDASHVQWGNAADKSSASAQVFTAGIVSTSPSGGIGYSTGAGGAVTQATSRSTAVTINTVTGQITTNNTSMLNGASASFTVNNTAVAIGDCVLVTTQSGRSPEVTSTAAGSFVLTYSNNTGGPDGASSIFNFAVIKAVAS